MDNADKPTADRGKKVQRVSMKTNSDSLRLLRLDCRWYEVLSSLRVHGEQTVSDKIILGKSCGLSGFRPKTASHLASQAPLSC